MVNDILIRDKYNELPKSIKDLIDSEISKPIPDDLKNALKQLIKSLGLPETESNTELNEHELLLIKSMKAIFIAQNIDDFTVITDDEKQKVLSIADCLSSFTDFYPDKEAKITIWLHF